VTETGWRNRIIGYDNVPPEQLRTNEMNWRVHPKFQAEALSGALDDVGWVQDIIINKRTGEGWPAERRGIETVVDGHLRIELAVARGEPTVPVKYVDLDEREETLVLATLDPLSALSQIDPVKLDALLEKARTDQIAIQQFLVWQAEEAGLYRDSPEDSSLAGMLPDGVVIPDHNIFVKDEEEWLECPECGYQWLR